MCLVKSVLHRKITITGGNEPKSSNNIYNISTTRFQQDAEVNATFRSASKTANSTHNFSIHISELFEQQLQKNNNKLHSHDLIETTFHAVVHHAVILKSATKPNSPNSTLYISGLYTKASPKHTNYSLISKTFSAKQTDTPIGDLQCQISKS